MATNAPFYSPKSTISERKRAAASLNHYYFMRYATHGCPPCHFPVDFFFRPVLPFVWRPLRTSHMASMAHVILRASKERGGGRGVSEKNRAPHFRQYFRRKYTFPSSASCSHLFIFLIFFASLSERHTIMRIESETGEVRTQIGRGARRRGRKYKQRRRRSSWRYYIYLHLYGADDDNDGDDDAAVDDDQDDGIVSRVPLKNINAIISMMMINAFVVPHRALPLAIFLFLFSLI